METIYDLAYKFLYELVIKLTDDYEEDEIFDEVLSFFKHNTHEDIFDLYNTYGYGKENLKEIMKLIIASKAYLTNLYRVKKGLDKNACANMVSLLESLNQDKILRLFQEENDICITLISDCIEYINSPFIFQNLSKELVIKSNKIKYVINLNQYELLDLYNYISSDEFTNSEMTIQFLFDTYDSALDYVYEDDFGEEDDYDSFDEFVDEIFIQKLEESLKEDELLCAYQYLFANVYELMITIPELDDYYKKDCSKIRDYLEKTPLETLIFEFKSDPKFALNIIDIFINNNQYLVDSELIIRRNIFKEKGNIQILSKLNPFFDEEERVFSKLVRDHKESSNKN